MTHFILDARTATPHFPGIGRYVSNLAQALPPLLDPDERLTLIPSPGYPLPIATSKAVRTLPISASPFSLSQQLRMPRRLRQLGADVYHSAYYMMPYRPQVPTVLTIYDLIPILLPEHSSGRARLLFRWTTSLALRASAQIITISEATRRDLLDHFHLPAERVITIPLATDPAFRPQPPASIAALRTRYGLPAQFTLYLGSNKPHKNLVRLIESWKLVNSKLVIAGAWDERYPEAQRRAGELGLRDTILWLGPVPETDLPALYAAAALFVFPSLYEGFGLPVLEALACGTPVVCSNRSSLPEVTGDAALLVNPLDVNALAEAIEHVLADQTLRTEMRAKGLAQALQFTWQKTAQQTLNLYRSLVDGSANPH